MLEVQARTVVKMFGYGSYRIKKPWFQFLSRTTQGFVEDQNPVICEENVLLASFWQPDRMFSGLLQPTRPITSPQEKQWCQRSGWILMGIPP